MSTFLVFFVPLALLALMLGAVQIGFNVGTHRRNRRQEEHAEIGPIIGAMLGLLGLLLGFAFSGATSRFIERDTIILREANSIGTAYLRADLMDEPARSTTRALLREYAAARLDLFSDVDAPNSGPKFERLTDLQQRLWAVASTEVRARPHLAVPVLSPINDVFDIFAERTAATRRHLPKIVLGLLIACATLSMATVGFNCGLHARKFAATAGPLAVLVAASLWLTVDLDYPRAGMIQLEGSALKDLVDALDAPAPAHP